MARRCYFAFHYQRDIWRVKVVTKSWVTKPDREAAGFYDASLWEESRKKGDEAIRKMILDGLKNTSVTAVLIGNQTSERRWVKFEIEESHKQGKGLLGVHIHSIENEEGEEDEAGRNPFDCITVEQNGKKVVLSTLYPVYWWFADNGYDNFGDWVEKAAKEAGR